MRSDVVLLLLMMGFVKVPALAIFLIEILTCCLVFYTIDPFTVFSTFDLDKLRKIASAIPGRLPENVLVKLPSLMAICLK